MDWKFELIDRNNVAIAISEPIGFSDLEFTLKRDLEKHGVFTLSQNNEFAFRKNGAKIIKDEYDTYGIEGLYYLRVKQSCGENSFEELFKGKLIFLHYEETSKDSLEVKIPIENSNELITILNKWNQKVNLESLVAFDGTTTLNAYNKIGFDLELPSKAISLHNDAINETNNEATFTIPDNITSSCIEIGMQKIKSSEIGGFYFSNTPNYSGIPSSAWSSALKYSVDISGISNYDAILVDFQSPIVNFSKSFQNVESLYNSDLKIDYRLKGKLYALNTPITDCLVSFFIRHTDNSFTVIHPTKIIYFNYTPSSGYTPLAQGQTVDFDLSFGGSIQLNEGDMLYFLLSFNPYQPLPNPQIIDAFKIEFNEETFFNMSGKSFYKPTTAKSYLINEAISRTAEIITDDKIKLYSEVFGRTDSQPYSHSADGEYSLMALTDGIRLRNQENRNNNISLFNISLKELFDGINPMFNIGIGIEPDINRTGYNRLRVEPWYYFYKNNIIHSCLGVNKITRKVIENEIFSQFKYGYEKWEAEEYTGLDEFLTNRTVRTTFDVVNNELTQLSKFITSGYAIEIGKRKMNDNSKDWKYDKNTFAISLTRKKLFKVKFDATTGSLSFPFIGDINDLFSGPPGATGNLSIGGTLYNNYSFTDSGRYVSNGLATIYVYGLPNITDEICDTVEFHSATFPSGSVFVETGNITSPQNIIDPPSIFNWRFRPLYCAIRWLNKLLSSYKNFNSNSILKFVDGEGNYYAEGEMTSTSGKLENGIIAENDDINKNILLVPAQAKPTLIPERVEYEFPLSSKDFKKIKANPDGKIYYEGNCSSGYGYIDTIVYKPKQGLAKFTLIPKY